MIFLALAAIAGVSYGRSMYNFYYDQEKRKYILKWTYVIILAVLLYLAYRYKR